MAATHLPAPGSNALAVRSNQALVPSDQMAAMLSTSPVPEVSGYCFFNGKAKDNITGKYLSYVLENKKIDLGKEPPLQTITKDAKSGTHGVVKINNIPFTVSYQEVAQFINRFAPVPMIRKNHDGYPIHIIMEKPTGKTMDCFVEFPNIEAAWACVRRFEYQQIGKLTKLGTRNVTLDLSNQAELMEAIFPRARLVQFNRFNGEPSVLARRGAIDWSEGFRGFFTLEEVYGAIKFAEYPGRSPFVLKCHQRVYESMISTLYKFPWASTGTYTVAARNALFEAAYKQLTVLYQKVGYSFIPPSANQTIPYQHKNSLLHNQPEPYFDNREVGLSQTLLFDLLFAAVNVPAFSYLQKLAICQAVGSYGRGVDIGHFAEHWPFQTLGPAKHAPNHVIKFWLELFDTGYDIMIQEDINTTFEKYIIFTRNNVGFPIGEWTKDGTELPFELATRLEQAVMMIYVEKGRAQWCFERNVHIRPWQTVTLNEFMRNIVTEKNIHEFSDEDAEPISPRTSVAFSLDGMDLLKLITSGSVTKSEPRAGIQPRRTSSLNPSTATEFIPASLRNASGTGSDGSSWIHVGAPQIITPTKPKTILQKPHPAPINAASIQQSFINPWTNLSTSTARAVGTPSDTSNNGVPLDLGLAPSTPNTVGEQMRKLSLASAASRCSLTSQATPASVSFTTAPNLTTSPTNYEVERRPSGASVASSLLPDSYSEHRSDNISALQHMCNDSATHSPVTILTTQTPTNPFGPIGSRPPPSGPAARNSNCQPVKPSIYPTVKPEKTRAYSVPVITRPPPSITSGSLTRSGAGVDSDNGTNVGARQRRSGPGGRLTSVELWAGLGKKFLEGLN